MIHKVFVGVAIREMNKPFKIMRTKVMYVKRKIVGIA